MEYVAKLTARHATGPLAAPVLRAPARVYTVRCVAEAAACIEGTGDEEGESFRALRRTDPSAGAHGPAQMGG